MLQYGGDEMMKERTSNLRKNQKQESKKQEEGKKYNCGHIRCRGSRGTMYMGMKGSGITCKDSQTLSPAAHLPKAQHTVVTSCLPISPRFCTICQDLTLLEVHQQRNARQSSRGYSPIAVGS